MSMLYRFFTFLLMLLMLSCVKEINLDDLRPEPSMVVNCVAISGEPLRVHVSRTWFYTEYSPVVTIDNAKVDLYVNGVHRETLAYDGGDPIFNFPGSYNSGYIPAEGDKIAVIATAPGYGKAEAETVIPAPAKLVNSKMELQLVDSMMSSMIRYRATFQLTLRDEADVDNYYWIRMEEGYPIFDTDEMRYTGDYYWMDMTIDYSSEPTLGGNINALDEIFGVTNMIGSNGLAFSDELFDGEDYTMRMFDNYFFMYDNVHFVGSVSRYDIDEELLKPIPPMRLRTHLYSISRDYYLYLKSLQDQSGNSFSNILIDAGLAEPVKVYSNINGGVGMFGGCHEGHLDSDIIFLSPKVNAARLKDGI